MNILESAMQYGDMGFRSFPVHGVKNGACTCGDPSCTKQGKHPMINGWKYKASSDHKKLKTLFIREDINIGIATGSGSKLVVIDVDPKNGGLESYEALKKIHGPLDECTLTANTGGGGFHLYYHYSGNDIGNYHGNIFGPGIDVKCNGGYVVGSPSTHISGNQYTWRNGLYAPAEMDFDLEQVIVEFNSQKPKDEHKWTKGTIENGTRNHRLFQIAAHYRANGMERDQIESKLLGDNLERCTNPLDTTEVKLIVKSASKYPKGSRQRSWRDYWVDCIYTEQCDLKATTKAILTALSKLMDENGGKCTATGELIALKANTRRETVSIHLTKASKAGWLHTSHIAKTDGSKGIFCSYVAAMPNKNN